MHRRPHHETLKAYIRKLSALALEVVASGGAGLAGSAAEGAPAGQAADELDLTGSREFLTRESAEELLAPMLAPGAKVSKVCGSGDAVWMSVGRQSGRVVVAGSTLLEFWMGWLLAGSAGVTAPALAAPLRRRRLPRPASRSGSAPRALAWRRRRWQQGPLRMLRAAWWMLT